LNLAAGPGDQAGRSPVRRSLIVPILKSIQRRSRAALFAGALILPLGAAVPADAHIVPVNDMVRGINMTPTQCASLPMTVWVVVSGRPFCIRYYLSTAGGRGTTPLVFLQGDRLGVLNLKTGAWSPSDKEKDIDTDDLMKVADSMSKQARTTAIYLGRAGVEGSSGDHRIRHTVLELNVTHAALDAIKRRHRFDGFHFVGQSGGSKLVGGLLALRQDIGCAVIGAGRLNSGKSKPAQDPAMIYFNVADAIPTIVSTQSARIILVTDPQDKKVPEQAQTSFARMMRQAGGRVEQYFVEAIDENRHGVLAYARLAATDCIRGTDPQEISRNVQALVQKRVADARLKAARANPNTRPNAAPIAAPNFAPHRAPAATLNQPPVRSPPQTPIGARRAAPTAS
jgi:hypothetical protein